MAKKKKVVKCFKIEQTDNDFTVSYAGFSTAELIGILTIERDRLIISALKSE